MNKQDVVDIIYHTLDYMYCDNCRFNSEITEEESIDKYGYWGCDDCHRKYNGWGISKASSESLTDKILEVLKNE